MKRKFLLCVLFSVLLKGCSSISTYSLSNHENTTKISDNNNTEKINSSSPTLLQNKTPTFTKENSHKDYTLLPSIDISILPLNVLQQALTIGINPNDLVYLYTIVKKSALDRNPYVLLDFMQFPMHQELRCPGDIIESAGEFISRFPIFMDETTRTNILHMTWDDVFISWRGIMFAANRRYDILFVPYCDKDCNNSSYHLVLEGFLQYDVYWEMVTGYPTAEPTYNPSLVKLGKYQITSSELNYIASGKYTQLDETLSAWKEFTLTLTESTLTMGPFYNVNIQYPNYKNKFENCLYKTLEVCKPEGDYRGLYAGGYSLGDLLFICENNETYRIAVLSEKRLGFPIRSDLDFGYLVLDFVR